MTITKKEQEHIDKIDNILSRLIDYAEQTKTDKSKSGIVVDYLQLKKMLNNIWLEIQKLEHYRCLLRDQERINKETRHLVLLEERSFTSDEVSDLLLNINSDSPPNAILTKRMKKHEEREKE